MTGNAVTASINDKLTGLGLELEDLRGQGYDSSGSMASAKTGASNNFKGSIS